MLCVLKWSLVVHTGHHQMVMSDTFQASDVRRRHQRAQNTEYKTLFIKILFRPCSSKSFQTYYAYHGHSVHYVVLSAASCPPPAVQLSSCLLTTWRASSIASRLISVTSLLVLEFVWRHSSADARWSAFSWTYRKPDWCLISHQETTWQLHSNMFVCCQSNW